LRVRRSLIQQDDEVPDPPGDLLGGLLEHRRLSSTASAAEVRRLQ
jgi:hypothetical protein